MPKRLKNEEEYHSIPTSSEAVACLPAGRQAKRRQNGRKIIFEMSSKESYDDARVTW
ncbi:MAG: hypothetical protein HYV34_03695 [Candidatus Kerfeldbacteria bacterium]|nr:hypothetical protein [Candidatus Kerfeldbacteria bacterium]